MTQKTIAHYRADLRLDLKCTGALWSDGELDRCLERAVADLSRFRPNEKKLELTVDAEVSAESFTTPAASDPDYFVDAEDCSDLDDGDTATLAHAVPDMPRPVLVTITDADTSITELIIIVKGYDVDNNYIEENFYLKDGLVQTGVKYFAQVTEVEFDEVTGEGAADVVDVGTGATAGVWVQLANKSIKWQSETVTGYTRDTDYEMDYRGGRIAMKSGTTMTDALDCTIDYTKSKIDIDISSIMEDLIRVSRVEYPVGNMPQTYALFEVFGSILTITGGFDSQSEVADAQHAAIQYQVAHSLPSASSPGSYPNFLDTSVQLAASAYALFMMALESEHQTITDLAAVRTELELTTGVHTLADAALDKAAALLVATTGKIDAALIKVTTYLETNGTTDNAKDRLAEITDMETYLRDLITKLADGTGALADANTNLDNVLTVTLDKATTGAEPYLDTGDSLIPEINKAGRVPERYAEYALARVKIADTRINLAIGFLQEANTRLALLKSYMEESDAWRRIGETFIYEAAQHIAAANAASLEASNRIYEIDRYLAEAAQYQQLAQNNIALADRWRAEAIERRNEAWAIWKDAPQYAPMYSISQRGQSP